MASTRSYRALPLHRLPCRNNERTRHANSILFPLQGHGADWLYLRLRHHHADAIRMTVIARKSTPQEA